MRTLLFFARISATVCCAASLTFAVTPCDHLKSVSIPNVTATAVETVAAGPY